MSRVSCIKGCQTPHEKGANAEADVVAYILLAT